jgi:hypothetical protein
MQRPCATAPARTARNGPPISDDRLNHLCAAVDEATLWSHLEAFAQWQKLSGTPAELESFRYLQKVLAGYGYRTRLLSHDAYISLPGPARIEIGDATPDCITHSFSQPSPAGGLRGPVVYAGLGRAEDFAAIDAHQKIVLLESIANPAASARGYWQVDGRWSEQPSQGNLTG